MKKLALFLSVAILALSSCKKEELEPAPATNNNGGSSGNGNTPTAITVPVIDNNNIFNVITVTNATVSTPFVDGNCVTPSCEISMNSNTEYQVTLTDQGGTVTLYQGTIHFDGSYQCTISNESPSNVYTLDYGDFCNNSNENRLVFN